MEKVPIRRRHTGSGSGFSYAQVIRYTKALTSKSLTSQPPRLQLRPTIVIEMGFVRVVDLSFFSRMCNAADLTTILLSKFGFAVTVNYLFFSRWRNAAYHTLLKLRALQHAA